MHAVPWLSTEKGPRSSYDEDGQWVRKGRSVQLAQREVPSVSPVGWDIFPALALPPCMLLTPTSGHAKKKQSSALSKSIQ